MKPISTQDGHEIHYAYSPADKVAIADVILAHGFASDKDEFEGLFQTAASQLSSHRLNAFRFDFRGNGESSLPQQEMTIQGELADLRAVSEALWSLNRLPQFLLGASFGAISAILYASEGGPRRVPGLVLWNPVINVQKTFYKPGTDWSRQAVNDENLAALREGRKYAVLESYKIGLPLMEEMVSIDLTPVLGSLGIPVLAYHGTNDTLVLTEYTVAAKAVSRDFALRLAEGAGHGFLGHHDAVVRESVEWICEVAQREPSGKGKVS